MSTFKYKLTDLYKYEKSLFNVYLYRKWGLREAVFPLLTSVNRDAGPSMMCVNEFPGV